MSRRPDGGSSVDAGFARVAAGLSFRQRVALLVALAIAATVAGASLAVWVIAKHELYKQLDQTLVAQAQGSGGPFGGSRFTRTIHSDGSVTGNAAIPITSRILRVARGQAPGFTTNTIEVFVSNLRRKLESGGEPRLLHTVRGVGYALREEP